MATFPKPLSSTVSLSTLALGVLLLTGCGPKEEVQVYEVAKPKVPRPYTLPDHWKVVGNTSSMRLATFEIQGDVAESKAEVSLLHMPNMEIADSQLINLWRQQVQLEPITEEQVSEVSREVTMGSLSGRLIDLSLPEVEGETSTDGIIAAFVRSTSGTWFTKMMGSPSLLEREHNVFTNFLASLDFPGLEKQLAASGAPHGGGMGAGPAPSTRSPQPTSAAPSGATDPSLPSWTPPSHWTSQGASSMVLAKFGAQQGAETASISVSAFPGDVGGLQANVNRWRGQVGLPSISSQAEMESSLEAFETGSGLPGTFVSLLGDTQALEAGILPYQGKSWFFTLKGPTSAVAAEKEGFRKFVQSVSF